MAVIFSGGREKINWAISRIGSGNSCGQEREISPPLVATISLLWPEKLVGAIPGLPADNF
jgi:hypothetical protein